MTEIRINSKTSAEEIYNVVKENSHWGNLSANMFLVNICEKMATNYDQIIVDQNEYELDIEGELDEIENFEESIEEKIKKLEAEIAELNKKKEAGTITPEEEKILEAKTEELNSLYTQSNNEIGNKKDNIDETIDLAKKSAEQIKAQVATDFGELAIEKGEPLTQVKDKRKSFWRKLFKTWDKSGTRKFGQKMIDTGNNLLDKVSTVGESTDKIEALRNKSATK